MITLQAGDKAPDFKGTDQDGVKVSLKDYKGKFLALFFYPQDLTPTCTVQACNLRDHYAVLRSSNIEVLGVSPDSADSHLKFKDKHALPMRLLPDTAHDIIDRYGVWGQKQLYGRTYMGLHRTTFLIGPDGRILRIFLRPKNKAHAEEILQAVKQSQLS
ncbi:thioredoxin-dependent thiol peroxidase [Flavihumibacter petaseus]|uniref:thioredoxin-dependent peroxiredoxin n=1 Tax=Flavihumibacter petaseus NBRC 106054 TaxID=1220578 RepID=A0A0E9MVN9_9BACT|nr:thioredoxin-dependent thiol peroxidase [Flavihumibacter petaseus]GAO41822.1 putative peroxiredoxin [Flavihumibacter petaseus NBRC 106054]